MSAISPAGEEPSRIVHVCEDRAAYAPIVELADRANLVNAARGTSFAEAMLDLANAWRVASDAHVLPDTIARQARDALDALGTMDSPLDVLTTLMAEVADAVGSDVGLPLNRTQRLSIASLVRRHIRKKRHEWPLMREKFKAQAIARTWELYLEQASFRSTVQGLSMFALTTIYFAYETYLGRVVSAFTRKVPPHREKHMRAELTTLFGAVRAAELWDTTVIAAARAIRHAHVHRADRLREEEVAIVTPFTECARGFALVSARETRKLVTELMPIVLGLTAEALAKLGERPSSDIPRVREDGALGRGSD